MLWVLSLIILVATTTIFTVAATLGDIPNQHEIISVPYHRQVTEYACGDASTEMVLDFWLSDIDQRSLIDVMRTSEDEGTLSYDIVRAGHFSHLSASPANLLFPDSAPKQGWGQPDRKFGLASFSYRSPNCWIDELMNVLAQGYPVICLMKYSLTDPGGHFRVAVVSPGYDKTEGTIKLLDPWDRDDQPHVVSYNLTTFCTLWNHSEPNEGIFYDPNYGAVIFPWTVDVSFIDSADNPNIATAAATNIARNDPAIHQRKLKNKNNAKTVTEDPAYETYVTAKINYPCPAPFCKPGQSTPFTADPANATIILPSYVSLAEGESATKSFGPFKATSTAQVTWKVLVSDPVDKQFDVTPIVVQAQGLITGDVPVTYCCPPDKEYPPYSYKDEIGAVGTVHLH